MSSLIVVIINSNSNNNNNNNNSILDFDNCTYTLSTIIIDGWEDLHAMAERSNVTELTLRWFFRGYIHMTLALLRDVCKTQDQLRLFRDYRSKEEFGWVTILTALQSLLRCTRCYKLSTKNQHTEFLASVIRRNECARQQNSYFTVKFWRNIVAVH